MTTKIDDLRDVAAAIRATDPCGAALVRWAAAQLDKQSCANCQNFYGRGYTAGYKAGANEWRVQPTGAEDGRG